MLRLEAEGRVLRGQFTARPSLVSLSPSSVILSEAKNPRSSPEAAKSTAEILRSAQNDMPSAQDDTTRRDEGHQLPIEWCDRRLLSRIHRLTLGALRREIQPVTRTQFMRWLLRWQHVAPGTQVNAERGVLEVIRQLQGFEAPASAWESQILARRVADYDPQILDQLCLTGAVGWGRLSPHPATLLVPEESTTLPSGDLAEACHSKPYAVILSEAKDLALGAQDKLREESRSALVPVHQSFSANQSEIPRSARNDTRMSTARRITPSSVAPITFFVREESDWMMPRHAPVAEVSRALSEVAREVLEYVRQRGASFFADIVRGTGRLKSEVETALWELVAAGLFTADGFDNLRALVDPKRRSGQGRGRMARPRHSTGRWALLFSGEAADRSKALEAVCRVLLGRYGVVFRELTLREEFPVKWRELLITFRRLEDRGEVRGGRFVDGFVGEQFALPSALESLRAARHADVGAHRDAPLHPELITLSAADPLNLVGIIVPGERVPAISGKTITLRDGALECDSELAVSSRPPAAEDTFAASQH
jgi:ATP-dependent helicase Lhr and Lhr-like helicase